MKWPWWLSARVLIPACLVFCLASHAIHRARLPALAAARADRDEARAQAQSAQLALQQLRSLPTPASVNPGDPAPSKSLERRLAGLVVDLRAGSMPASVTIDAMSASGLAAATATPTAIASFARPLPLAGGRLRAVAVSVRGRYGHLDGLQAWFERVREQPVALKAFSASGQRFELHFWVIGT